MIVLEVFCLLLSRSQVCLLLLRDRCFAASDTFTASWFLWRDWHLLLFAFDFLAFFKLGNFGTGVGADVSNLLPSGTVVGSCQSVDLFSLDILARLLIDLKWMSPRLEQGTLTSCNPLVIILNQVLLEAVLVLA